MGELRHECGIAAAYHFLDQPLSPLVPQIPRLDPEGKWVGHPDINGASRLIPRMLLDMQNRGQLASGISSYDSTRPTRIRTYKALGTVSEGFSLNQKKAFEELMLHNAGNAAIGHVRYATCGGDDLESAQPFEREHGRITRWFAFAFNGQLTNFPDLRKELLDRGDYHLKRNVDTEILMHAISQEMAKQGEVEAIDWRQVFETLSTRLDGSYNIVLISATGELVVVRDPLGFRPLCIVEEGSLFAAASESLPLANLGFQTDRIRSLEPGHLVVAGPRGVRIEQFSQGAKRAHCFFEWIYFANVASTLDSRSVYLTRVELGRELARQELASADKLTLDETTIVVPVPDTAKAVADAMAHDLDVPTYEGLMRNRHVGRTFIEGEEDRQAKVRLKYTPLPEVLEGKRVILVEDSIVRSTTLKALVRAIWERGRPREIHLRIACPPIVAPCFYGIDMSSISQLIAPKYADSENLRLSPKAELKLAEWLGANSLRYLSLDSIARSIGMPANQLCRACLTADYPTECGKRLYQEELGKQPIAPTDPTNPPSRDVHTCLNGTETSGKRSRAYEVHRQPASVGDAGVWRPAS